MPTILSKIREQASRVRPTATIAVGVGVGVSVALAACALYGTRDKKQPPPCHNNNNYKVRQFLTIHNKLLCWKQIHTDFTPMRNEGISGIAALANGPALTRSFPYVEMDRSYNLLRSVHSFRRYFCLSITNLKSSFISFVRIPC